MSYITDDELIEYAKTTLTYRLDIHSPPIDVTTFGYWYEPDRDWEFVCHCGNKIHWGLDDDDDNIVCGTIKIECDEFWYDYDGCYPEKKYLCEKCRAEIEPVYKEHHPSGFREFVNGRRECTLDEYDVPENMIDKIYKILMDREAAGDFGKSIGVLGPASMLT